MLLDCNDIVPDYQTRYGWKTIAYSGGVPIFWAELRLRYPAELTTELVEEVGQDGFGIGVLPWPG